MKNSKSKISVLFAAALFAGTVACQPASDGSDSATNTQPPLEQTQTPATATTPDQMQDTSMVSTDSLSSTMPN